MYTLKLRNLEFINKNINEIGKNKNLKFIISCDYNNFNYISINYGEFVHKTKNCAIWKIEK